MWFNVRTDNESTMERQKPSPSSHRGSGGESNQVGEISRIDNFIQSSEAHSFGQGAVGLRERQRLFAAALLDPTMPLPHGLVGPDREPSARRFNVYRNNVVLGLIEALKTAYPAVCRIVGEEFFMAMARAYAVLEPPATPIMLEYGATFPDFIEAFEPAQCVPYLADIARLERAWLEAYHAAEAMPINPASLGALDHQHLSQVRFTLHPSLRIVRSSYPIAQIWAMNSDGGTPAAIDTFGGGEDVIVLRPAVEVWVRVVAASAAAFVLSLQAGASISGAAACAINAHPDFDLAAVLRDLFAIEAVTGWSLQQEAASIATERCA